MDVDALTMAGRAPQPNILVLVYLPQPSQRQLQIGVKITSTFCRFQIGQYLFKYLSYW